MDGARTIIQPRNQITVTPKPATPALLTASSASLYTAPSATTNTGSTRGALLDQIVLCNTDSSDRTVTMHIVPVGQSLGTVYTILSAATVKAGQTLVIEFGPQGHPMAAGAQVYGKASVTSVVACRLGLRELT